MTAKAVKPRIPVSDLKAIAQAQVIYLVLIQSAVEQIRNLPDSYLQAFNLAKTQLEHILADIAKRTSQEEAQALFDACYQNSQPKNPLPTENVNNDNEVQV